MRLPVEPQPHRGRERELGGDRSVSRPGEVERWPQMERLALPQAGPAQQQVILAQALPQNGDQGPAAAGSLLEQALKRDPRWLLRILQPGFLSPLVPRAADRRAKVGWQPRLEQPQVGDRRAKGWVWQPAQLQQDWGQRVVQRQPEAVNQQAAGAAPSDRPLHCRPQAAPG